MKDKIIQVLLAYQHEAIAYNIMTFEEAYINATYEIAPVSKRTRMMTMTRMMEMEIGKL